MSDPQPINYYTEIRLDGRREFRLFPTEIRIASIGSFGALGNLAEFTIPLQSIRPTPNRVWQRHRTFGPCLFGAVIAATIAFVAFFGQFSYLVRFEGTFFGALCAVLFGGLAAYTSPRIEYASWVSDAGVVSFDVAASGPHVRRFPEFVGHVIRTIEATRGNVT